MDKPLVSVHILTYNQAPYIAQAIEGALQQQTEFPFEIVVGEDCSTDGTREIVFGYGARHPQAIEVVTSDRNVGPAANSLRVRQACRGKYVAFCDGDDWWTDVRKLQKQIDLLEAHPEYSLCCHDVDVITDGVSRIKRYETLVGDTFSFDDAAKSHFIPTLSVVVRRELVDSPPQWAMDCVSGDIPMWLLALDQGPGCYIHEKMGVKRDNPGGISGDPERRKGVPHSFLRMYQQLNAHTKGRHRDVLYWKMASLSREIARGHLRSRQGLPFLYRFLVSLFYDKTVVYRWVRSYVARALSDGAAVES